MKKLFIILTLGFWVHTSFAQNDENYKYMRGSLCIMMVEHPTLEFNAQIEKAFEKMPIPNRFNSHELGVRVLSFPNNDDQLANLKIFSSENQLAKRIVSKWFGRDKATGAFNTDLLRERGHYSATKIDVKAAMAQQRGTAVLEDDADKASEFKGDNDLFNMEYVGSVTSTSSKTSISGVTTNEQMIRKVCTRALDKNIADLQHKFADFRIKAPLISVEPLKAYVGMKEDINEKSRYEVLEAVPDDRGVTTYKRVGLIKPIKGKIWDNRFMADEEKTTEAALDGTLFEKISGKDFYPGMLIRETK